MERLNNLRLVKFVSKNINLFYDKYNNYVNLLIPISLLMTLIFNSFYMNTFNMFFKMLLFIKSIMEINSKSNLDLSLIKQWSFEYISFLILDLFAPILFYPLSNILYLNYYYWLFKEGYFINDPVKRNNFIDKILSYVLRWFSINKYGIVSFMNLMIILINYIFTNIQIMIIKLNDLYTYWKTKKAADNLSEAVLDENINNYVSASTKEENIAEEINAETDDSSELIESIAEQNAMELDDNLDDLIDSKKNN